MLAALLAAQEDLEKTAAIEDGALGVQTSGAVASEGQTSEGQAARAAATGVTYSGFVAREGALAGEQAGEPAGEPPLDSPDQPQKKRVGFSAWKVVAPIAACLVVGAIVIGVGSLGQSQSAMPTDSVKEAASAQSYAARTESHVEAMAEEESGLVADGYVAGSQSYMPDEPPVGPEPTSPFNTEEYAAVDENGFVSTRTQPLSTVSADVDTASYANVRRMIAQGTSLDEIPSGAVRAEEMLNYFTYDYQTPTGSDLFSMQAQASTCPWNPNTQLLVLGFATAPETGAADKGSNLVFLIDVSGSMGSEDKLPLLQDSFTTLLENLGPNDRVSIVTYSGQEEVVLEGASGDDTAQIMRAIYKLKAHGSTNGEAGLRMAYDVASRNFIEGGVNRIVMASDGDLNVGMTSQSDLFDFVEKKRETGVYLSVLGFGSGNYKDTKMETLADHGNGSYHYIDCIEEADRVLSEKLMANLVPFADDVKVQVEFNPSQVKGYRLIGYENRSLAAEDFLDDTVDAGDVGPNAQFTVAYEIVPADSSYEIKTPDLKYSSSEYASKSSDWLTCSLRYRAFSDGEVHEQQLAVDESDATARPSDDWKFASAVIEYAMIAGKSNYQGTASIDSILKMLGEVENTPERASFADLVRDSATNTGR